jgi:ribosomal-protein-alanine N-acetyltransferase
MIETKRLLLREFLAEDLPVLHVILSDPITMSFWPEPFSLERTEEWIQRSIASYAKNRFGRWAVKLKKNGRIIGDVGIMLAEIDGHAERDLGYIVYKDFWNNGYATEAALACVEYAFNSLGIKRLVAIMSHDNIASARVAEKTGMKRKKEFLYKKNRDVLTYLYAIEN